jgi:hypothetical protein
VQETLGLRASRFTPGYNMAGFQPGEGPSIMLASHVLFVFNVDDDSASARLDPAGSLQQITRVNMREIKKRLTSGFRPFAIRTTDGQEFPVPHPEFVLVGKYTIAVVDKHGFINILDPLHIVSTRDLARRNGHS